MTGAPEVSVVIPTRNRWPILSQTLAIVLGQEDVKLEVVVVDDASTDETPARLAEIEDLRLRVLRNDPNRGVAGARNRGVREAAAEWVAFLDDDDLWAPRKLRTQLDALARDGEAVFAYGAAVVLDEERGEVRPDAPAPDPAELRELLRFGNALPGGCSNVVARTEAVRDAGGFDERLSMLADWDLWLRLADRGAGVRCPEVLVAYRRHSRNMTLLDLGHMDHELDYFAGKQREARGMEFDYKGYSRWLAGEAATPLMAARLYLRTGMRYRSPGNVALAGATLLGARAAERAARRARSALRARRGAPKPDPFTAPEWLERHRHAPGAA